MAIPSTNTMANHIASMFQQRLISRTEAFNQFADGEEVMGNKKPAKKQDRNLDDEMMKLIPIGACVRCQSLLYLGMTNCSKCGAPVGESIDLEEVQERVHELLKPEAEVVYQEVPVYTTGKMTYVAMSSDACFIDTTMAWSTSAGPTSWDIDWRIGST